MEEVMTSLRLNRLQLADERTKRANALTVSDPLPQFVRIRVAWLKKMIGKGR
jgi:hypothetical protein